jgi:Domain of unknown function (DUF4386)
MDYESAVSPEESRRISLATGVLFLITFIASIPALYLFQPVLDDPVGYVAGAGDTNRIFLGALLELITILANIGTAVVLYPLLKRQNDVLALGFVASRLLECTFMAVGVISVLTIVTLQQDVSRFDEGTFGAIAYTLAAIKDWTFLLGPGFVVGIGNGMILGYLMYRSALVPSWMAMLGLIGGPLIVLSGIAVLFDVDQPGGPLQGIATIPEFLWELLLGLYLTVKGFKAAPILSGAHQSDSRRPSPTPA